MTLPIEQQWSVDKDLFLKDLLNSEIIKCHSYRTAHVPKPSECVDFGFDGSYPYSEIDSWMRKQNYNHDNHIVLLCKFADGKVRAVHKTDFYFIVGYDDTVKKA